MRYQPGLRVHAHGDDSGKDIGGDQENLQRRHPITNRWAAERCSTKMRAPLSESNEDRIILLPGLHGNRQGRNLRPLGTPDVTVRSKGLTVSSLLSAPASSFQRGTRLSQLCKPAS